MQKIIFIGNLGRNPEIKTFENGGKIANFSVGVTERSYTTKSGVQVPQHTEWFECVARNGLADVVEKYVKKGHKVHIEAKKRTRVYTSSDGMERRVVEFIVEGLELLTPKEHRSDVMPPAEPLIPQPEETFKGEDDLPF